MADYFADNPTLAGVVLIVAVVFAGMVSENLGSRIECFIDGKSSGCDDVISEWRDYLCLNFKDGEPVGHRYLRTVVARMKFELATLAALGVGFVGFGALQCNFSVVTVAQFWTCFAVWASLSAFLYLEAISSATLLAKTRKLLLAEYGGELKSRKSS